MKALLVRLEYANGERFEFNKSIRDLLKTQDMQAWRKEPEKFPFWFRDALKTTLDNIEIVLR